MSDLEILGEKCEMVVIMGLWGHNTCMWLSLFRAVKTSTLVFLMKDQKKRRGGNSKEQVCERNTRRGNREMSKEMSFFKLDLFSYHFFYFSSNFLFVNLYKKIGENVFFWGFKCALCEKKQTEEKSSVTGWSWRILFHVMNMDGPFAYYD